MGDGSVAREICEEREIISSKIKSKTGCHRQPVFFFEPFRIDLFFFNWFVRRTKCLKLAVKCPSYEKI